MAEGALRTSGLSSQASRTEIPIIIGAKQVQFREALFEASWSQQGSGLIDLTLQPMPELLDTAIDVISRCFVRQRQQRFQFLEA